MSFSFHQRDVLWQHDNFNSTLCPGINTPIFTLPLIIHHIHTFPQTQQDPQTQHSISPTTNTITDIDMGDRYSDNRRRERNRDPGNRNHSGGRHGSVQRLGENDLPIDNSMEDFVGRIGRMILEDMQAELIRREGGGRTRYPPPRQNSPPRHQPRPRHRSPVYTSPPGYDWHRSGAPVHPAAPSGRRDRSPPRHRPSRHDHPSDGHRHGGRVVDRYTAHNEREIQDFLDRRDARVEGNRINVYESDSDNTRHGGRSAHGRNDHDRELNDRNRGRNDRNHGYTPSGRYAPDPYLPPPRHIPHRTPSVDSLVSEREENLEVTRVASGARIDIARYLTAVPRPPANSTCSICMDAEPAPLMKPHCCTHLFHQSCLDDWLNSANENCNKCPICRQEVCPATERRPITADVRREDRDPFGPGGSGWIVYDDD
jgi:hypothetical protein